MYEKKARLAYVTINRPDRHNAFDSETSRELYQAFSDFRDDEDLAVAILTGAGDHAFCVGADLAEMAQALEAGRSPDYEVPFGGITSKFQCWKPMIAAINGFCLAGGLELALTCDIRVASDNASFGLPEPKHAIIPGAGGTQRLTRAIPLAYAMEMLLSGERFDAQWASRTGLVSRVVPSRQLMSTVEEIADKIIECGPVAVRAIKQAAYHGLDLKLSEGLSLESEVMQMVMASADAREGPLAFIQKRKPTYKGA